VLFLASDEKYRQRDVAWVMLCDFFYEFVTYLKFAKRIAIFVQRLCLKFSITIT